MKAKIGTALTILTSLLSVQNLHASEQVPPSSRWLIKLNNGARFIASRIDVPRDEARAVNAERTSKALEKINATPCVRDGVIFSTEYELSDIKKLTIDRSHPAVTDPKYIINGIPYAGTLGVSAFYPLVVETVGGVKFSTIPARTIEGSAWKICNKADHITHVYALKELDIHISEGVDYSIPTMGISDLSILRDEDVQAINAEAEKDIASITPQSSIEAITNILGKYRSLNVSSVAEKLSPLYQEKSKAQRSEFEKHVAEFQAAKQDAAKSKEASRQAMIKSLKVGDDTNCGPVLEVRQGLVKVYRPVQNFGNEHWIKAGKLSLPGEACTFVNGEYISQ